MSKTDEFGMSKDVWIARCVEKSWGQILKEHGEMKKKLEELETGGEAMSETRKEEVKNYTITREECEKTIRGVCEGCGGKLEPIKTVDNAGSPTFWVSCQHCQSYRAGVEERIFKIARQLVESGEMRGYHHMSPADYPDGEKRDYYLDTQTAEMSRQVSRIEFLLSVSRSPLDKEDLCQTK